MRIARMHSTAFWRRAASLVLMLALLVPLGAVARHRARQLPVQPQLLAVVNQQPDARVRIIVQRLSNDHSLEHQVSSLGGQVTKDLHIINAFVAELPAKAVPVLAQSDNVRWVSLDGAIRQSDHDENTSVSNTFTTWSRNLGTVITNGFTSNASIIDSPLGANSTFGYGSKVKGAFADFPIQITPGQKIEKMELVLRTYVPAKLAYDPKVVVYVDGKASSSKSIPKTTWDPHIGATNVGTVYVDITGTREQWKWGDFNNNLQVLLDQSTLTTGTVYYDAIGLRVTSIPGSDSTGFLTPTNLAAATIGTTNLKDIHSKVVRAPEVWNQGPTYLQGQGLTVAIVDSGVLKHKDNDGRFLGSVNFNTGYQDSSDRYGHGTHVASIITGSGAHSNGGRIGIAPKTNLLNVRVSDDQGMATESDVVDALQFIHQYKDSLKIKVVNLSLNAATAQSYHTSPLCAAVEILWFNGITVVVSAGNNGTSTLYPPANDPFVITVGATDDKGTLSMGDDVVATFSAAGTTQDNFAKPDLVAPGRNIIAHVPENDELRVGQDHPTNRVDNYYFRMSGTSMAAPIVSGAVALLLQDEPTLTPDQVKHRLMATAVKDTVKWPGYSATHAGAGYLDIYAAVNGSTTASANTGIAPSNLLSTGSTPMTISTWDSASWGSASWGSASWGSASWGSASWGSTYWE